ncbi:MAG: phosphoribosylglycinamide formyltransferase [bacterium]|nr:phosphoribosylglycinamide formyltransferase [bacterium]
MRIAYFASGSGSTFQFLVESARTEQLPCDHALLICSNMNAFALSRARELDVPAEVIRRRDFPSPVEHGQALLKALRTAQCDAICLCGFLELIPHAVVQAYRHKIVNIHPALLPAFGGHGMYGKRVHEAVLQYGARITGATVHFVDEEYDHGPVIAQIPVRVDPADTPDSLAARVQAAEKNLYFGALRLLVRDRLRIHDRIVTILP